MQRQTLCPNSLHLQYLLKVLDLLYMCHFQKSISQKAISKIKIIQVY